MSGKKKKLDLSSLEKKDGKYVMPLLVPIKFGNEEIKEVLLAEPKAKHMRSLPGQPSMSDILDMIGKLGNLTDSQVDDLSMKDTNRMAEFIAAFE